MHSLSRNSHFKLIIFMNCLCHWKPNKGFKKEIWYLHVLRHSGAVFIQLFHFFNKFHMFLKPLSWKLASAQLPCLDGNLWLNKPWIFNSGLLWHTCLRNSYWQYLSQWKDMIINHCHKPVFLLWYISGQQCQLMQTKLMEWQGLNLHHPSLEEKRQN